MESSDFAERLKSLRAKAGLTQTALAEKAGLARSAIAKLEGGENVPSWPTVQKLAAALGVDCRAFQDAEPEPTKPASRKKRNQ